jgi:site-specific DNA-methyltransferase (adenine-specific)
MEINKIYNKDFRKCLNDLPKIDMIITDPPYNINFKYDVYNDNLSDDDYIKLIANLKGFPLAIIHYPEETMKYFVPSLGVPNEVITWCYSSNLPGRQSRLINFYNCSVDLNKVKQPYKNPTDKRVAKLIENGSEGCRLYDWFSDINLVKNVSKDKSNHPCPIPIKLYERIILLTTKEGDTVMDPFAGQGNFAIACKNLNRNFIGFELSREYCDTANERILLT